MLRIFALIDRLAPGIYIVLGVIILWHMWRLLRASGEYRATSFELEKDLTRVRQANAFTTIVLMSQVGLVVLGIQFSALPFLQQQDDFASIPISIVEDTAFATSTPPPFVQSGLDIEPVAPLDADDNPGVLIKPTLTPTPVGTIVPNAPASEGCNEEGATLQVPANGMRVFQPIAVIGTAFAENFSVAKVEIKGPGTNDTYGVVGDTLQEVRSNAAFSQFSPAPYSEGLYQFRLMVFDITGNPVSSCMVNIYISPPPVTPTPTLTPAPGQ